MFSILVGTVVKENDQITEVRIEIIIYPPCDATSDGVVFSTDDFTKLQARILPKQVIGTLHSHPNTTPCISKIDIDSANEFGEVIMGIFSYWRDKPEDRVRQKSFDWYSGLRRMEVEVLEG